MSAKFLNLSDPSLGGGHPITIWWSESQPDRMTLSINDPRFTEVDGTKPGLRVVFSSNPNSADYSPGNYNRCARVLRGLGMPAPAEDVPEHPRHLRYREHVKAAVATGAPVGAPVEAQAGHAPAAGSMATADAAVCDQCLCLVADLAKHEALVH